MTSTRYDEQWFARADYLLQAYFDTPATSASRARADEALTRFASTPVVGAPQYANGTIFSLDTPAASPRSLIQARVIEPGSAAGRVVHSVVFDPAAYDRTQGAVIDWFYVSPSAAMLALGVSRGGSEQSELLIFDRESDTFLSDDFSAVNTRHASLSWLPDESGFAYSRYRMHHHYGRELYLHRLGQPVKSDQLLWATDPEDIAWPDITISPDGRLALVHVSRNWTGTDVFLLDLERLTHCEVVCATFGKTRLVFTSESQLVGVSSVRQPTGEVFRVHQDSPEIDRWVSIFSDDSLVIDHLAVSGTSIFLVGATAMSSWAGRLELTSSEAYEFQMAPLPAIGSIPILASTPSQSIMRNQVITPLSPEHAAFSWSSPTHTPRMLVWSTAQGLHNLDESLEAAATIVGAPKALDTANLTESDIRVRTVTCGTSDGNQLPLLILEPRNCDLGEKLPTLVHAYGGFGLSADASFNLTAAAWVHLGGRYVIAGIRGGREFGDVWHRVSLGPGKFNVIFDALTVLDYLVDEGLCSREQLGFWGSSNGGLLAATLITMAPDACRAVYSAVPLTDMLRYTSLSIARLWEPDYGDPNVAADRRWLRAYSPLHNIPDRAEFPAVLIATGTNDSRVDPTHSYRFWEKLQNSENVADRPSLIKVNRNAGHGPGKPRGQFVAEWADILGFFLHELGAVGSE